MDDIHFDGITIQRFWQKVDRRGPDECWPWKASHRSKGYGAFCYRRNGKMVQGRAHRFSYELHKGPLADDQVLLHSCDNPPCVNPAHLSPGTKADNNRDMCAKGRHVAGGTHGPGDYERGERHHNAKLTEEIVAQIRADRAVLSYSALARKYGIAIGHAFRIVNGKAWKNA